MSISTALQKLATYRANNIRASQDTFEQGILVLNSNAIPKLGDDGWAFLEQLALAAIDVGQTKVADRCLRQLSDKFPDSPRVDVLIGIRMEATESPETVLKYYDDLLEIDSANAALWKRRISVIRRMGKIEKAVEELSQFLDTFYIDLDGWLELADIYSSCNQYTHALQALSHAQLLEPQNPFYFLQFAETAYTADDLPLALKMFLIVVDMSERDVAQPAKEHVSVGISVRAWWGIKLCARRLIALPANHVVSASNTPISRNLRLIDELATERVLMAYSVTGKEARSGKDAECKDVVFKWMAAP